MDVKKYFNYNPELELTAAQIGINKWDWEYAPRYDEVYAKKVMALNRFDILPISIEGKVSHYYQTETWGNYSKVAVKEFNEADTVYYRLSFLDLIRKMLHEDRYHYFLADSKEILGLVSLNNLNCLAVYNFIYQITASLEQLVSGYLKNKFKEQQIIDWLKQSTDEQASKVISEYEKLKEKNAENSIFEYLFFPTLGTLLKKAAPEIKQDKPKLLDYRTKFCAGNLYWEIRNTVSHPVKPLFINEQSVKNVNELISDYVEIRDILKNEKP